MRYFADFFFITFIGVGGGQGLSFPNTLENIDDNTTDYFASENSICVCQVAV